MIYYLLYYFCTHTLGLFEIPSQFTSHDEAHLYFSHNPFAPEYASLDGLIALQLSVPLLYTPFIFLHVLSSMTQLSGQFAITGGHSPIRFALIML